jgi:hypothetical protein
VVFKKQSGEIKVKKLLGLFIGLAWVPMAFMSGCGSSNPSDPGNSAHPTATPAPYSTPQTTAQAAVVLGAASTYAVLASTQITNSGASTLCGSMGLDPGTLINGGILVQCGGVTDVNNQNALNAEAALGTAYTNISPANRPGGAVLPPGADIGGQTLYPGLYYESASLNLSSADLTLSAPSGSNTVFIFQVENNLIIGPGRKIILAGNATAANVFWQVAGYCSLNTTAQFYGTIMTYTSVTLNTGAALNGRALAETGDVTLLGNTITLP